MNHTIESSALHFSGNQKFNSILFCSFAFFKQLSAVVSQLRKIVSIVDVKQFICDTRNGLKWPEWNESISLITYRLDYTQWRISVSHSKCWSLSRRKSILFDTPSQSIFLFSNSANQFRIFPFSNCSFRLSFIFCHCKCFFHFAIFFLFCTVRNSNAWHLTYCLRFSLKRNRKCMLISVLLSVELLIARFVYACDECQ